MVKTSDLGIPSSNLENIPSKEERKKRNLEIAIANLLTSEVPPQLSNVKVPDSILNFSRPGD